MKSLIRENEVYLETEWTVWTKIHLDWECDPKPMGNGYTLVEDYRPTE